jgi:hypothetical protein
MRCSASTRWAVGTLAVVAIALSVDSLRRSRATFAPTRAPQIAIRGQLEAFKRHDYRAAYRYAAPEIQEMYPLTDFRRMVEAGFPELAQWKQFALGAPVMRGDTVGVAVTVSPKKGVLAHFVYWMRHEANGWRVAGVEHDHAFVPPHPGIRRRPVRPPEPQETTSIDRRSQAG